MPLHATTLDAVIAHHALAAPDRVALSFEGRTTTYAGLTAEVRALRALLAEQGVSRGHRVAYLGKNSDRYIVLLMALVSLGSVLVPLNWRLADEEWRYILADSGAVRLFADDEFLTRAEHLAHDRGLAAPTSIPEPPLPVAADAQLEEPCTPADAEAIVLQIYTSGTTGRPKGAMLSHRNMLALRAPGYVADLAWFPRQDDRSLLVLPVSHIAGTAYALFGLYGGGCIVITREFDAGDTLRQIAHQHVTHMLLAPSALQILLDHPDFDSYDLSSFRYLTYGASPIPEALMARAVASLSCGFVQMYGMTEAAGGVVALTPEDHRGSNKECLRSAGRAMPGVEVAVAGAPDASTGSDVVGEILIRSAAVMKGYWHRPEATLEAIDADGWLRSGDIGRMDADGYVYILDRAKDMIISGGENIYPAEVENVLFSHPDIADVAVFGVPCDRWGEVPVAALVMRRDREPDPAALERWCGDNLARFKIPRHYLVVPELPRNAGNKVLKRELRSRFAHLGDAG